MHATVGSAGQVPDHPCVNVAEEYFTFFGLCAYTLNILQNPFDLGAGEIGCQRQTDFFAEAILAAIFGKLIADSVGAGILPDNRVVNRLAGCLLPDDRGLTLIGYTDRGEVLGRNIAFLESAFDHFLAALPDFDGIVFHPAWLWVDLFVFLLINRYNFACMIED